MAVLHGKFGDCYFHSQRRMRGSFAGKAFFGRRLRRLRPKRQTQQTRKTSHIWHVTYQEGCFNCDWKMQMEKLFLQVQEVPPYSLYFTARMAIRKTISQNSWFEAIAGIDRLDIPEVLKNLIRMDQRTIL